MSMPRVALCAVARSGSSMMMRVLEEGGLTIDTDGKVPDEFTKFIMREPYGFRENYDAINNNIFINSFKLLNPDKFAVVPSDYKFIFIYRSLGEIQNSWRVVAEKYNGVPNANFPTTDKLVWAEQKYNAWQAILAANPEKFLILNYNTVCANPSQMVTDVSNFINTSTFNFDITKAALAVDQSLHVDRSSP